MDTRARKLRVGSTTKTIKLNSELKIIKTKTIGLGVLLSVAAAAMCFATNPTLGTWKLNESKSKFGDGIGKSIMMVWEKAGETRNARCMVWTLRVRKLT